jgi:hypothetical protein
MMDYRVSVMPEHVKKTWFGQNCGEEKIGRYNYFPPNMEEISMEDYFRLGRSYSPIAHEFRQPCWEKEITDVSSMHIDWFGDGTWLAVAYCRGGIRFYRGAICKHEMKCDKKLGNCWYHYTCSKCGYEDEIDSSD